MTDNQHFQVIVGGLISSPSSCYEVQDLLGCGTYGAVTQCRKLATNEMVAVKILKTRKCIEEAKEEEMILKKMKELGSDKFNIVRWNESFTYNGHFCLEFEKLDINLCEFLQRSYFGCLQLAEIRPILKQLATALEFLKNAGVVHADLKPENIMMVDHLWKPLKVKVIDFGLACLNPEAWTGVTVQTLWYRSPEVLLGTSFNEAIDVWSLGCIAAEMLMGTPLFPGSDEYDMMRHILHTIGKPPEHLLNAGLHTKQFFCEEHTGSEPPQWRFMSQLEVRNFPCTLRTIHSLRDLQKTAHNLTGENATADELDRACFVDLVTKMLKVDASERITPSQILQHPFITMSHIVGTFDNSFPAKLSMEMMSLCQGATTDDGEEWAQASLVVEASDSPACPSSSTYHSVPEDHSGGVSGMEQSILQSNIISMENSPANKRKRHGVDDSECGNRSPDTTPAKRRRNEWMEAAQTETEGQTSPRKSPLQKRKRDDADPCTTPDGNSPAKKRRSVNHNKELMDSVKSVRNQQQISSGTITDNQHFQDIVGDPISSPSSYHVVQDFLGCGTYGEASDGPAYPSSSTYHSFPNEGDPDGVSDTQQSVLQSNVTSRENSPANKRKRHGVDDSECGNRSPDTTPAKRRRNEWMEAAQTETEGQTSPRKSPLQKRKRDDADPCTTPDGNSPAKKRRSVNLNKELMDSVKKILSNTEEPWSSLTQVTQLKKRKRADEEASGSKQEKTSPVKRRRGSLDGGEG